MTDDLGRRLEERLGSPTKGPDVGDVVRRGRKRRMRARVYSGVSVVLVVALAWTAVSRFDVLDRHEGKFVAGPDATDHQTFGGWRIEVRLRPSRVGPLVLATGPLRAAPQNNAHPWLRHDLIFRNRSDRPLRFDDTRTSKFLRQSGHAILLAADEGCGYGLPSPDAAAEAGACRDYLDAFTVEGHASVTREITLSKDLSGMADLGEGVYPFRKDISFTVGSSGRKYHRTISIVYHVQREDGL